MMHRHTAVLLSAVITSIVAAPALAQTSLKAAQADSSQALDMQLKMEEAVLAPQRAMFRRYFQQAYRRYPSIPSGTLEAMAFVQSRWSNLQPRQAQDANHLRMPASWGVMGLYAGQGFEDQVGEGARLLGVSSDAVRTDVATNILAAAALLDAQIRQDIPDADARTNATPEAIRPALMRYAGFAPAGAQAARSGGNIDTYARTSFAYDVLLAQDRGVNDRGIVVPERPIAWEDAFDAPQLVTLRAPMVRLDVSGDRVDTGAYHIDPVSETLQANAARADARATAGIDATIQSTDYGPAIWSAASSSNYAASRAAAISAVTVHTTQGSYAGTISWFKNASAQVSAHYVIRSSDGQVTQMVRDAHTAWHVGSQNSYTLGIEHEGYVDNSSWYTNAMYEASAALVRNFCAKYSAISCASAYSGPSSSGINVLATSVKIKGHQHYSGQTHTDPGINWNWSKYYALINPGSGGGTGAVTYLDRFESSVGHFDTSPSYSGSTTGISTASTATRDCTTQKNGSCSLRVLLKDNTASTASWAVRLLSGAGTPANNTALARSNGVVGFWVWTGGSGVSVGVGIDDSDGTERSTSKAIAANTWTYVSWPLSDAAQWNAWVDGNGAITASSVKLDAIWLYHANTAYDINVYIDDVQIKN
ncbi:peptidoglycan recognition family protein [Stenotrophomonas sp. MH1]|uniref:N-acetylmuramoyl-L-alanine amidase n=1 Tax=Stenotrophomonas capsici TaxID=3110230 RepID=A0ABU5V6R9_9GAMM|nr:peptidoglycan recognition family protein [Stenotrophomonas sp. MH1]MEA5668180.1 peptidoglycan recognition family protein [Stenotrophomonas sp. MH1]